MAERTKSELVDAATEAGVQGADDLTKTEIEGKLETLAPAELGPVIPEGETEPSPPKPGSATTGIQPINKSDIPKAGL